MNHLPEHEISSGNVFADLGLPHPEARQRRAECRRALEALGLTPEEVARALQPLDSFILMLAENEAAKP